MVILAIWIGYSICVSILLLYVCKISIKNKNKLNSIISDLHAKSLINEKQLSKQIETLQRMLVSESEEKAKYYKRVIELENGIKTGTGISLRQEISKYEGLFNENELYCIKSGIYNSIKERYNNLIDIKFYVALIEKISDHLSKIEKSKESKDNV